MCCTQKQVSEVSPAFTIMDDEVVDADSQLQGCTVLCWYSKKTSEAPHINVENHGNMFIDGMLFSLPNSPEVVRDVTACKDEPVT